MAKMPESVKSILDDARNRYYGKTTTKKPSTDPEKSKPLEDVVPPVKDSESSSKEVRKGEIMEKSASSASAASPPRRTVKKGKKVLRKIGDSTVNLSKEIAPNAPNVPVEMAKETTARASEDENPASLFSLNVSEELVSYNKIFSSAEITSQPLEKKTNSRPSSYSSGEAPLKKRKKDVDSMAVDSIEAVANKEIMDHVVAEEGQSSIAHVMNMRQKDLITNVVALDKTPGDDPVTDVQAADPIDKDKNEEELVVNNTEVTVDHHIANVDNSPPSTQNIPPSDPIIIIDEQPMTVEGHAISNEEFQAFRAEMAKLKEEVVRLRGDLIDVKGELVNVKDELITVKRELVKMKTTDLEVEKSKHFMKGGICLLQDLVLKGLISPEEAMNSTIWR